MNTLINDCRTLITFTGTLFLQAFEPYNNCNQRFTLETDSLDEAINFIKEHYFTPDLDIDVCDI